MDEDDAPRRWPDAMFGFINVILLMLIFFLVAGRVTPPLDPSLDLVETDGLDPTDPPDALVLGPDGALTYRGEAAEPGPFVAALPAEERALVRIVPDRAAPAARLVEVAAALRAAGAGTVALVTVQALE